MDNEELMMKYYHVIHPLHIGCQSPVCRRKHNKHHHINLLHTIVTLFNSMLKKQHCLQVILPEVKTSYLHLRQKGNMFDLPKCTLEIHKRSFLPRCLFKFI